MLELESVRHSTLENNRDRSCNRLVRYFSLCRERACGTNRLAGRTKTNITALITQ